MEAHNYDINFKSLFLDSKKACKVNFPAIITEINSETEKITFSVRSFKKDGICYKGLSVIKGEIWPIPKIGQAVEIKEIYFKLDDNFSQSLFVKLSLKNEINAIAKEKNEILDFSSDKIISQLKSLMNINQFLTSNIFIINDDSNENVYNLTCIENNTTLKLKKKEINFDSAFKKKDIIYIVNYFLDKINIKLTAISLIEKLTEEKLFILLEKLLKEKKISYKLMFFGKIIDIDRNKGNIILLGYDKNLFQKKEKKRIKLDKLKLEKFKEENSIEIKKLNESNNYNKIEEEREENEEIKVLGLGQFVILTDYYIKTNKKENEFPELIEEEKSFIFFSEQNLYFSDKIQLNKFSVIQIYFNDFEDNNFYNKIEINMDKKEENIIKSKMNFIIETNRKKNYDYYPIYIRLISDKNNKHYKYKIFCFTLMHGFINKINAFINYTSDNSYLY